jgi:pterin-4a-carbinolamine dehydratase
MMAVIDLAEKAHLLKHHPDSADLSSVVAKLSSDVLDFT